MYVLMCIMCAYVCMYVNIMCMYMLSMYACVYVDVCKRVCVCIMNMYVHECLCVCVCVCVFVFVYSCSNTWRQNPPPSIAEVKGRVKLQLYCPRWAFDTSSRVRLPEYCKALCNLPCCFSALINCCCGRCLLVVCSHTTRSLYGCRYFLPF